VAEVPRGHAPGIFLGIKAEKRGVLKQNTRSFDNEWRVKSALFGLMTSQPRRSPRYSSYIHVNSWTTLFKFQIRSNCALSAKSDLGPAAANAPRRLTVPTNVIGRVERSSESGATGAVRN
jgi:hypothetical protein